MSPEKDAKLVADFPLLYRRRHDSPKETCMCWGFACADGWEPIIRLTSAALEAHAKAVAPHLCAEQVKEKFGSLRIYLNHHDELVHALQVLAGWLSETTCEECGTRPARICQRPTGSVRTLCETCGPAWERRALPRG